VESDTWDKQEGPSKLDLKNSFSIINIQNQNSKFAQHFKEYRRSFWTYGGYYVNRESC
jgi:hypothetical protein